MPEQPEGQAGISLKPTMGPAMDEYKLLLNVTSKGGKLERRPSIIAKHLGYGYLGRDISGTDAFQYNADGTTGTAAEYAKQTGSAANEQHSGRFWVAPGMCPVDTHQTKNGTIAQDIYPIVDTAYHPAPRWERKDIVEGIDVEIVNGKLICFYAARHRLLQTTGAATGGKTIAAANTDIRMCISVHSVAEPMIGALGLSQKATNLYGLSYSSPATAWQLYGRTIADGKDVPDLANAGPLKVGSTKHNSWGVYNSIKFWKKRIQRAMKGFVVSGYGVGGNIWDKGLGFTSFIENLEVFDDSGLQTVTTSTIEDPEGLLWFTGLQLPFFRIGSPVTDIDRDVPKNMIYAKRRPHRAFMFMSPEGYPIWYGFQSLDIQEVQQTEAFNNAFNEGVPVQLRSGVKYFLDPGMVWYAELLVPNSLPSTGYMMAVEASRSPEVIGMSNTTNGTVCFTRDTIELLVGNYISQTNKTVHTGIGADSRWSILNVGPGTAFLNKDGLHYMGPTPGEQQGVPIAVRRIKAFDELFGAGVSFERTPYSDLVVGESSTETVASHANSDTRYSQELAKVERHGSLPIGTYKVDKTRLDRAVSGVWEELYLCAVSRDIDEPGDDNRLVLVWNYKDDTCTVWLMPQHMGIRGFAYDGSISAPYIMTRYGLAQFAGNKQHDEPFWPIQVASDADQFRVDIKSEISVGQWGLLVQGIEDNTPVDPTDRQTGDSATGNDQYALPVLLAGQSHFISGAGEAFVSPKIMITHEKTRFGWTRQYTPVPRVQNDWLAFLKDDDTDMRVQVWGNNTDLEAGTTNEKYVVSSFSSEESDYDMKSLVMGSSGMLDSLYKGNNEKEFRAVRVHPENTDAGTKTVDHTHGHVRFGASYTVDDEDIMPSRRLRGPVLRTSTVRSHLTSTKQQFQFFTVDPGTIHSVMIQVEKVVPPGGRA